MQALSLLLFRGQYDFVLLSEVWLRSDHKKMAIAVQAGGLHITRYDKFNTGCDGRVWPWGCSGLAIVSKFPILEQNFTKFEDQASFCKIVCDGEYFAGKGVGRVMVSPQPGLQLSVIVTHTICDKANSKIRERQVDEVLEVIEKSPGDFILLGGDLNASKTAEGDQSYSKLKKVMTDTFLENEAAQSPWLDPQFATLGNKRNFYSGKSKPVILDYLLFKQITKKPAKIWSSDFHMPVLTTIRDSDKTKISLSDHEAIYSKIFLWKE